MPDAVYAFDLRLSNPIPGGGKVVITVPVAIAITTPVLTGLTPTTGLTVAISG